MTGAGRGLGFAIAKALHDAGATVAINDRTSDACDAAIARLGSGRRLIAAPADLSTPDGPASGRPGRERRPARLPHQQRRRKCRTADRGDRRRALGHALHVILRASFLTVQAALPLLKASRGSIINMASELGLHAIANNVAYVSAKHGLVAHDQSDGHRAGARRRASECAVPGHHGYRADAGLRGGQRRPGGLLRSLQPLPSGRTAGLARRDRCSSFYACSRRRPGS